MVYLTGDTHGDFHRFTTDNFQEQKEMTKDDYVIILGDFGGIWSGTKDERYWLNWLNDKPFTTLFIDGNHENFTLLNQYPVVEYHGGKAHKIRDSVLHLMRGYVFEFDEKKFWAFGGASSHDISDGILDPADDDFEKKLHFYKACKLEFRVKGVSWWKEEMPSGEEMKRGLDELYKINYAPDFILTHCLPQGAAAVFSMGTYMHDDLTMYLNGIDRNLLPRKKWYCGHYHTDLQLIGRYNMLYRKIERVV